MERGAPVAKKDLEGEQSPGRIGFDGISNGDVRMPDPKVEQGLEADARRNDATPSNGWGEPDGARERQGGNGCGDAVRLPAGNILRGVRTALRGG